MSTEKRRNICGIRVFGVASAEIADWGGQAQYPGIARLPIILPDGVKNVNNSASGKGSPRVNGIRRNYRY
ncbi:MAG: hypothetical protein ACE5NJ_03025 [Thermodesulfobacteriota bacterium]